MNNTNTRKLFRTVISFSAAATIGTLAYGGVPLNNLQGKAREASPSTRSPIRQGCHGTATEEATPRTPWRRQTPH